MGIGNVADCDYANARVRARRTRLLGPAGLRDLVASEGLGACLDRLLRSGYGPHLRPWLEREADPLRAVDRGLEALVVREALRLESFLEGRPRELYRAALRVQDGTTLKALIRGLAAAEPVDRLLARLPPSPGLPADLLQELASLPGPEAVADALSERRSPLAAPLRKALAAAGNEAGKGVLRLEVEIDRALLSSALRTTRRSGADGRIVRALLSAAADHANAATLLQLDHEAGAKDLFLPGGGLDAERFASLAALAPEARREALAAWLGRARGRSVALAEALAVPARAEQVLTQARERALRREARERPLSLAVCLAYLAELRGEARRVRLVLRGGEFGLPAEELLDLLEA